MKRFVATISLLAALSVFGSPAWSNPDFLQAEPAMTTQFGWNLEPNGMLTVGYDLNHNGRPDFFTVRVVLYKYITGDRSKPSPGTTRVIWCSASITVLRDSITSPPGIRCSMRSTSTRMVTGTSCTRTCWRTASTVTRSFMTARPDGSALCRSVESGRIINL